MRLVFGAKTGGLEQTAGRRCWHLDGPAARPRRGERRPRSIGFTLPLNRQFLHRNQHHPFIGYASEADLPALYAGASAYLFPSLYEGYGLPVLEAMASGTPVLTSDRGSCPEVAAGHAVIADPEDVDALVAGIAAAVAMPQDRLAAALAYARTRTWAATARGTLDVWREVAAQA